VRYPKSAIAVLLLAALGCSPPCLGWSAKGHDIVTSKAISLLPAGLRPFYRTNSRFVVALDVLPDLWRDTHRADEGFHHFVDLEFYATPPSFSGIPESFRQAERRYGRPNMLKWGVLPWAIMERCNRLAQAFRKQDLAGIAVQSALLSHYVADLHVPFHVTSVYDGRKPSQKGLHHRFEIAIVARCIRSQDLRPGAPPAVTDVWKSLVSWMSDSHRALGKLNDADENAKAESGAYNERYYGLFAKTARPVAERRLSLGASRVAALYIWAWKKAGKPSLPPKAAPLFWGD